jgi:ElaB/YqjD/DUF883 family membrane-anchored ribosome-binding protein
MDTNEEAVQRDTDALRADLAQLRSDLSSLSTTLREAAGGLGADAYAQVRETAQRARAEAERRAEDLTATMSERPVVSVMVAFVAGLVLGLLFSRR